MGALADKIVITRGATPIVATSLLTRVATVRARIVNRRETHNHDVVDARTMNCGVARCVTGQKSKKRMAEEAK